MTTISEAIDEALPYDATWVRALLRTAPVGSGSLAWYRYWRQTRNSHSRGAESWLVIRPLAFCHFRMRHDHVRVIDEIVVMPSKRRQGIATTLVRHVGTPVEMRIPVTNLGARAWAEALRFQPTLTLKLPKGRVIVYRLD